ncbi:hypothetical protein HA402_011246 [Bradysia odoriphaga]|nr:hypothetical protein HA402_011246 [Bradysia odoriphaga]
MTPEGQATVSADDMLTVLADAGYRGVDLGPVGFLGEGKELRARLAHHALELAGGWVQLPFSDDEAFEASLGSLHEALRVFSDAASDAPTRLPLPTLADDGSLARRAHPGRGAEVDPLADAAWQRLAVNAERAASLVRTAGFEPTFHHHAGTFVESPEEIDRFLANVDIDLTLDTGHLLIGGGDPAEAVTRWGDRINHLHLKDIDVAELRRVLAAGGGMAEVWSSGSFVAFGRGDLDLAAVMDAMDARGFDGWVVVEQDVLNAPDVAIDAFRAERAADQRVNRDALSAWVHAANIAASADAELAWIADPFIDGARGVAERFGGTATASPDELLASGEIDAVLIASPTPTHVDLIEKAVDRGLPVLCEKPIDLDIARVEALRPKVAASGVPVALGFNRRFDPAFAEVRTRVAAGEIGALEQLTIISRDPAAPPADYVAVSGGIFRDMTIHDFDMARFFLPDIVSVSATGTNTFDEGARTHGDYDTAVVTLRAASGAIVTIINSRHSATGYDQRIEAFGAGGTLQVANRSTSLVTLSTATAVEAGAPYEDFFLQRYAEAYAAELASFVALTRGEASQSSSFDDGRAALVLADAAARSAAEGVAVAVAL